MFGLFSPCCSLIILLTLVCRKFQIEVHFARAFKIWAKKYPLELVRNMTRFKSLRDTSCTGSYYEPVLEVLCCSIYKLPLSLLFFPTE